MKKQLSLILGLLLMIPALPAAAGWLESDSAKAIDARIKRDFPYSVEEFYELAVKENPRYTLNDLQKDINDRIVETLVVDGQTKVFRKALRNMKLQRNARSSKWGGRGAAASDTRISYVDSVLDFQTAKNPLGGAHRVKYRFSIDVPVTEDIVGDSVMVWMPVPLATQRQKDIKIIDSYPKKHVLSADRSPHNSIYFEAPAKNIGDTLHFWYTAEYITQGEYFPEDYILKNIKDYDINSDIYKAYTEFEAPHIIRLDSLARKIVGNETNPYKKSELVYNYINSTYPWAGAREYSTIPSIPEYVIEEGHGDCGQVALLYISLMRTLGIPARWESGWMLHPGEKNLHDWAEVYFEGIGWVPVDLSFGRYSRAKSKDAKNFYSHGIDAHRFAANHAVGHQFYPPKRFVRSETVDAQMGEVETTKGNLFYPDWSQHLELISVEPCYIENIQCETPALNDSMALVSIPVATIRTEPAHRAEISTQAVMGMPVSIIGSKGDWYHIMTAEGYTGWVPDSSVRLMSPEEFNRWRVSDNRRVVSDFWQGRVYSDATSSSPRDIVSDIVLGTVLEFDPTASLENNPLGRVPVVLPDGRRGWTDATLIYIGEWASQPFDAEKILDTAYSMEGTPYHWGGTSTKAIDCSGLVKVSYLNNGLILKRDASQQATTGQELDPDDWTDYQAGDLLFFGNKKTGKITHVAIYDSDGMYVHSSGRVKRNSLDKNSDKYLYSPLKAVRINGMIGTDGIIPAISHPWFFLSR